MKLKSIFLGVGTFLLMCSLSYAGPLPVVFLDSVVAIGRKDTTPGPNLGRWIGEATGFIYGDFVTKNSEQKSLYQPYLVTNRHVIEEHLAAAGGPLSIIYQAQSEVRQPFAGIRLSSRRGWHSDLACTPRPFG